MISDINVKTVVCAASAYAGITFQGVSIDIRLDPGRSAASSLRCWALEELAAANRRTQRAMLAIAAAQALDRRGAGATHVQSEEAQVECAGDLLARIAGFAEHYAPSTAKEAGGQEIIDRARSMAQLMRGVEVQRHPDKAST